MTIQPSEQADAGLITVSDKDGIAESLGFYDKSSGLFILGKDEGINLAIDSTGPYESLNTASNDFATIEAFNGVGALTLSEPGKPIISLG